MVLNKNKVGIPEGSVYIGRGSMWGNPFVMGRDGDRDSVCEQYSNFLKQEILSGRITLEQLAPLHGKDLVCFCAPLRCHGDTLTLAAAWAASKLKENL